MDDESLNLGVHVLITGGSGLVGRYLTSLLLGEGYKVSHLSRKQDQFGRVRVYRWDPSRGLLNPEILNRVDYIIHLAGANLGEKKWSETRKAEILDSRIGSAQLLHRVVTENGFPLKAFISASGINYYGCVTTDKIYREEDPPGNDFPGEVCRLWEEAADRFKSNGIRTVKIRSGVVLEIHGSAFSRLRLPAKFGVFPTLGKGNQYLSWIHIKGLCGIYLNAIRDSEIEGAYNAASPHYTKQRDFMKILSRVLNRAYFHPGVPEFILRGLYGEMSSVILDGSRVSSQKIINTGYRFEFDNLYNALSDIIYLRSAFRQS